MYLSRLYIKNYRSIKEIDLEFKKWKNVIVWRNNAWKSNIIKALDLVLWESSPTYHKSENITESDFFNNNIKEPLYIFCELINEEDFTENDFDIMYQNCFWFKTYSQVSEWENGKPKSKKLKELDLSNDLSNLSIFFDKNEENVWYDTDWMDLKNPHKQQLENILTWKRKFAFVFKAFKEKDTIFKEIRFLMKSSTEEKWGMAFKDNLRNIFLQSAIIPAFRDTKDQLRISNYSWYWKLLKSYIKSDDKDLLDALNNVKTQWQTVFNDMQEKVWDTNINIAFPNTKISFQFNPEKQDIYKNTQIYIDDWFNSPLQDKGSWIQSAVIIWLFDFYVRNIAHSWNSLLAIEEPELYLHPHWRRVISDRLNDFLNWWKNQVIVATHSSEFVVPLADDLNVIVLRKDNAEWTKWKNIDFSWIENIKRKQILIKKEVAEMFFADCVILTEDSKHFIEEVAKIIWEEEIELWKNWLNNNNITVLNCWWKTWFQEYRILLNYADIPNYILADFDYLRDWWINNILNEELRTELNTLKSKITTSYEDLEIDLDELKESLEKNDWGTLKNRFDNYHKEVKRRLKNWAYKKISEIEQIFHKDINDLREKLKEEWIFFLDWELEDNYLYGYKPKKDKEWGVIETIAKMMEEWKQISDFLEIRELEEFLLAVARKQKIMKSIDFKKSVPVEEISVEDIPF